MSVSIVLVGAALAIAAVDRRPAAARSPRRGPARHRRRSGRGHRRVGLGVPSLSEGTDAEFWSSVFFLSSIAGFVTVMASSC